MKVLIKYKLYRKGVFSIAEGYEASELITVEEGGDVGEAIEKDYKKWQATAPSNVGVVLLDFKII